MTSAIARGSIDIDAEVRSQHACIQLVRYHFLEPPESTLYASDNFRIDLCLTARHRSSRASFIDLWNPRRFERIGDLFLLPPAIGIRAASDESSSISSLVCQLDAGFLLALFDELPEVNDRMLTASLDIKDARVRNLLLRLAEEARHPGFASALLIDSIVTQTAIELFRIGVGVREQPDQGGLAPWQLRQIDERLKEIRESPTLAEIASICRISVRQLTRGFRASRGCSIGTYVANSQIEHAKQMLDNGKSVSAIAEILGFSTASNFGVAFRRATGLTPGQYRRRII